MENETKFDSLPTEIVHRIIFSGYLSSQDVLNVALASKTMKEIVLGDEFAVRRAKSSTRDHIWLTKRYEWKAIRTGLIYGTLDPQETLNTMVFFNHKKKSQFNGDVDSWLLAAHKAIAQGAVPEDFWYIVDICQRYVVQVIVNHGLLFANEDDNATAQRRFDIIAHYVPLSKKKIEGLSTYERLSFDRGLVMTSDSHECLELYDDSFACKSLELSSYSTHFQ